MAPRPVSETEIGLPGALWAIDRVANLVWSELGVNVTVTPLDCPADTVNAVGDTAKSAASSPPTVICVTESVPIPELVTVRTAWALESTSIWPIARAVSEMLIAGPAAVSRVANTPRPTDPA